MYSPKIREDLVPRIYRAARKAGVAMTQWVNQVLEHALPENPVENQTRKEKSNECE
jgi:predicted HicB family RNase H-like nuclease